MANRGQATVKSNEEEARGIEDTLTALGIDADLTPDEAAQEAAEETTSSVDVEEVDEEEVEEEEEDDGEPPASSTQVDVEIPPPVGAPLPEPEPEPILVPPPKPPKPKGRQKPPGAAKIGKGLADKVPGAEKVKVFKREKGKRWFINDYTKDDLALYPDFESFLTHYVKDDHGAGEYDLVGVDAHNREIELGQVRLRAAAARSTDQSAMSVVQQMLAQQQKRDEDYLKRMRETMQPPPQQNPLELLAGVMNLQEKVTGKADAAQDAAAAQASGGMAAAFQAMSASGDKSMQMMMAMMQQQQASAQQQNQLMMTLLAKPKEEDPIMKLLLMKLMEDGGSGGGGGLAPPPPPPKDNTVELITALGSFMAAMGGGGEGEDDFKEFLKTMLSQKQSEGLSTKEALQLFMQKGDKDDQDPFKNAVDNMAAIMNITQNVNRSQEGGPAAGFFDALAALFSNRDFAGSIANTIRAKTDQGQSIQRTQTVAAEQRLAMQQRLLQRQQQEAALAAAGSVSQPMVTPPPGGGPPVPPSPHEVQKAAERTVARTGRLPQLPANTHEHINALAAATDEGELVGRTVTMLVYFAEFEDWRPFTEQVLGFARSGNKQGTLEYLTAFFDGLVEISLIDPTLSKKIVQSIDQHFPVLRQQLSDMPLDGDEEITGDGLLDPGEDPVDPGGNDGGDA